MFAKYEVNRDKSIIAFFDFIPSSYWIDLLRTSQELKDWLI